MAMELNFITFTNPAETQRASNRRYIRTTVLKKYHAQRRSAREKALGELGLPGRTIAPKEENAEKRHCRERALVSRTARGSPPLNMHLDASLADAFSVLPITLSHLDRLYLDRYIAFAYGMDMLIDTPQKRMPLTSVYLPAAMKDSITLYSMLLTGAQCFDQSEQDPASRAQTRYHCALYRGRLLQSISKALDDDRTVVSDCTIAGLVKLETDEWLAGNKEQFNLHANAIRNIVRLSGGLHALGMQGFLSELILRVDQAAASYFASEPYFPQTVHLNLRTSIEALPIGFLSQPVFSNLSGEVLNLLNNIASILVHFDHDNGTPENGSFPWESATEIETTLMTVCAKRKTFSEKCDMPELQECVCLAAELFWMRVVKGYTAATYGGPLTSQELIGNLSKSLSRSCLQAEHLKLILWVAFTGTLVVDASVTEEWVHIISSVTFRLGIKRLREFKSTLKTFLWMKPKSDMLANGTWKQVKDLSLRYKVKSGPTFNPS
ncbi:hypothetical protein B0O99DRAFT_685512 [Bisporella sp. PMI_857]|nr:hypothetical protein B0O99DRAFT_685512 [Bisporella sp. PMI_857]